MTTGPGPNNDVPQPTADSMLLYQAETTLLKVTERALMPTGLSAPQLMLLGALYFDARPLVPNRLRNTLVVEAQSLTGTIDRLETAGLAKRLNHPKDRRKIRIQITAKGRAKYEQAAVASDEAMAVFFKPLTVTERAAFRTTLMKLRRAGYPALRLLHEKAYPPAS